jgi:hypothetical protein
MKHNDRRCCICHSPITCCTAFTVARDFVDFMKGKTKRVREICPKCDKVLGAAVKKRGLTNYYCKDK